MLRRKAGIKPLAKTPPFLVLSRQDRLRSKQMIIQSHGRRFAHAIREALGAPGYLFGNFMVPDYAQYMLDGTEVEDEHRGITQVLLDFLKHNI